MGSLAKGSLRKVCGNSAEILPKVRGQYVFIAPGKGAEILRKVCRNFTEICGKFSAMTPSRTTPYPLTQNYYLRKIILKQVFLKNYESHA